LAVDYKECLKRFKNPEMCRFGFRVSQLAEGLGLEECIERRGPQKCLDACLKSCKGENCGELCASALNAAAAVGIARRLIHWAVEAARKTRLTIPEAVAVGFYMLLDEPGSDCATRVSSMRVMGLAAVELRNLLGMRKMLLLMAPAVAKAYECIGDDAFTILDMAAPAIGQDMAKRIAAALDEGVVKIRRVVLTFPPAKPA
jgi:hypothetical protein